MFKKWEVVIIEFGDIFDNLENSLIKEDLINGVNIGKEFSYKHYGVVLSPHFLNKYKVVVLPITGKREKYNCNYNNMICLSKNRYTFLSKDSVILLNDIRSVSINRIEKFKDTKGNNTQFFIKHKEQSEIIEKFKKLFLE